VVRAVEMSLAPSTKPAPRRSGRLVLENTDPAIPLDRVPFFVSDLRRVGVVMLIMVALLVAGAELVIPHLIA
jgi:nucleosome binding factor SPN SPT16 subunit